MLKLNDLLAVIHDEEAVTIVVGTKNSPDTFAILEEIPVEALLKKAEKYIAKEVFDYKVVGVWTIENDYRLTDTIGIKVLDE